MTSLRRACLLLSLPVALAACHQHAADTSAATAASGASAAGFEHAPIAESAKASPAQVDNARLDKVKAAHGFTVGNPAASRTVYVFFDPQCPHCGQAWRELKSLWPAAKFVWIPVAVTNNMQTSTLQGAALLDAKQVVEAMDAHEELLKNHQGGMSVKDSDVTSASKDAIDRNSTTLIGLGANQVPYMVGIDERTGRLAAIIGEVSADGLKRALGWKDQAVTEPAAQPASQPAAASAPSAPNPAPTPVPAAPRVAPTTGKAS